MSGTELYAYLDGERSGTFTFRSGQVTYVYGDEAPVTPMSLSMPRRRVRHTNRVASAFLWGLLPDNESALSSMASVAGTSPSSLVGLLGHFGRDVAGAVQLLPAQVVPDDAVHRNVDDVADNVLSPEDLERILHGAVDRYNGRSAPGDRADEFRFSVAGAQPKVALTDRGDGRWLVPDPTLPSTHIIKPVRLDSSDKLHDIDAMELITLRAATSLGLKTSEATLWDAPSGDLRALVTTRYDRCRDPLPGGGHRIRRLHQEDLVQALGVHPSKKYQRHDGGPGVGAIAELFATRTGSASVTLARDFFRGFVFNVGILGTDAHAKNYSVLLDGNGVSLAPLYDLISAAAHLGEEGGHDVVPYFPMSVHKEYRLAEMTVSGIVAEGRRLGLREDEARTIVETILAGIPEAMADAAGSVGRPDLGARILPALRRFSPVRFVTSL